MMLSIGFFSPALADPTDSMDFNFDPLMRPADDASQPPAWEDSRIPKIDIETNDLKHAAAELTALALKAGAAKEGFKHIEACPAHPGNDFYKVELHLRGVRLGDAIKYMCQQSGNGYRRLHGIGSIQAWSPEHLSVLGLPGDYLKNLLVDDHGGITGERIAEALADVGARISAKDVFVLDKSISILCDVHQAEYIKALILAHSRGRRIVPGEIPPEPEDLSPSKVTRRIRRPEGGDKARQAADWLHLKIPAIDINTRDISVAFADLESLALEAGAGKLGFERINVLVSDTQKHDTDLVALHLVNSTFLSAIRQACRNSRTTWNVSGGTIRIRLWDSRLEVSTRIPDYYITPLLPKPGKSMSPRTLATWFSERGANLTDENIFILPRSVLLVGPGSEIEYAQALVIIASKGFDASLKSFAEPSSNHPMRKGPVKAAPPSTLPRH